MNNIVEFILITLKNDPILILGLLSMFALGLAAWTIYALIIALKHGVGGR